MGRHLFSLIAGLLAAVLAAPAMATAALPTYLGVWLIAEAHPAPWRPTPYPGDLLESRKLVGRKIVYTPRGITAPAPLACRDPQYRLREVGPDYLFQGGLTSPQAQATALGFGPRITTLETGCEGWFEFHFVNDRTAMFALDNMIYTLRKR